MCEIESAALRRGALRTHSADCTQATKAAFRPKPRVWHRAGSNLFRLARDVVVILLPGPSTYYRSCTFSRCYGYSAGETAGTTVHGRSIPLECNDAYPAWSADDFSASSQLKQAEVARL